MTKVCNWVKEITYKNNSMLKRYSRKKDFIKVADIVLDKELCKKKKKRKTLIQFKTTINKKLFAEKKEWLYIFTLNNEILKIGGINKKLC
jgi:hypothetical protein